MTVSEQLELDLRSDYLFRPTNPQGAIVNEPFSSSTAEARPKTYLKEMGVILAKPFTASVLAA